MIRLTTISEAIANGSVASNLLAAAAGWFCLVKHTLYSCMQNSRKENALDTLQDT